MVWSLDARIPVRLLDMPDAPPRAGSEALSGAVLLAEDGAALPPGAARVEHFAAPPAGAHPAGCACCQPRNPVAIALDRLFLARARGQAPWFTEVLAIARSEAGRDAIAAALQGDSVTRARFRTG
ncbi:hypothetical protein [Teichococcus oryzae]|nr:hypothetical protein [Pseudoroseomonas oryzae]